MFEQVLDGDVALAVIVKVVEDECCAGSSVELGLVVTLHQCHVDPDGFGEQTEVELHVHSHCRRVETILGP